MAAYIPVINIHVKAFIYSTQMSLILMSSRDTVNNQQLKSVTHPPGPTLISEQQIQIPNKALGFVTDLETDLWDINSPLSHSRLRLHRV